MSSVVQLKQEIEFNRNLAGLLDALKSIAAQQFLSLERTFRSNAKYFEAIETIAGMFDLANFVHPFTEPDGPIAVVLVTSDTGLLGGLNQQVVIAAVKEYQRNPGELIVIGERGHNHLRERGLDAKTFPGVLDQGRRGLAGQVRSYAYQRVRSGAVKGLTIVFPRALSFTSHRVELIRVLPCTEWLKKSQVSRGVHSDPVLLESRMVDVLEYLVWARLGQELYEVFGMSRLAELAARSVHLEGSSQELEQRGEKLRLRYFRQRHELIDCGMRELFSARSLFNKMDVS